jgi:hypothetical protein
MSLAHRLARVEQALPGDWCLHVPPRVTIDGVMENSLRDQTIPACACGRPRLHIAVEYTDAA